MDLESLPWGLEGYSKGLPERGQTFITFAAILETTKATLWGNRVDVNALFS
jgi:hypothetical protein